MTTEIPLVSIIVITYNSARYVLKTLESARFQSYRNIELIISDDASSDMTVELCENWIASNRERFHNIMLLTSRFNTGTSSNCNRAIKLAAGEWIKLIGGDDILTNKCIEENMQFISLNSHIKLLFSDCVIIDENHKEIGHLSNNSEFFGLSAKKQYQKLIWANYVATPTAFINASVFKIIGGFDERIRIVEDYPFWIKATKNDYKLYYFNVDTVLYRKLSSLLDIKQSLSSYQADLLLIFKHYRLKGTNVKNFWYLFHDWLYLKSLRSPLHRIIIIFLPVHFLRFLLNEYLKTKSNGSFNYTGIRDIRYKVSGYLKGKLARRRL
jgi:glycosyltransferase involved in cell wall biosynthesis